MGGEIQSHYLLILFTHIFSLFRLFLHFGHALFFLGPLKRSDRQEAASPACMRLVWGDHSKSRNGIKRIRWNPSSHKYKQYQSTQEQFLPSIDPHVTTHHSVPKCLRMEAGLHAGPVTTLLQEEAQNCGESDFQIGLLAFLFRWSLEVLQPKVQFELKSSLERLGGNP